MTDLGAPIHYHQGESGSLLIQSRRGAGIRSVEPIGKIRQDPSFLHQHGKTADGQFKARRTVEDFLNLYFASRGNKVSS